MAERSKTGGRQKGTPNKVTQEVRQALCQFAQENMEAFQNAFAQIEEPEKKAKIYLELCKYVVPTAQLMSIHTQAEEKTIEDALIKLSEGL